MVAPSWTFWGMPIYSLIRQLFSVWVSWGILNFPSAMKYGGRPFEEGFVISSKENSFELMTTPMGATGVHGLPSRYKSRVDIAIQPKHEWIDFDLSKINKFVFLSFWSTENRENLRKAPSSQIPPSLPHLLLWWLWQTLVEWHWISGFPSKIHTECYGQQLTGWNDEMMAENNITVGYSNKPLSSSFPQSEEQIQ